MAQPWDELLRFWFGTASDPQQIAREQAALWWGGQPQTDALIRARWSELRAAAVRGELESWAAAPRGRLALIVLVDQFSRCLFRGSAQAFAEDARARRWCLEGLSHGVDQQLQPIERVFFYLPLEHSESIEDQRDAVALFETLLAEVPAEQHDTFAGYLFYALRHAQIIERFGRFPHRNAVLGRESSAEELEFLQQPGSSF